MGVEFWRIFMGGGERSRVLDESLPTSLFSPEPIIKGKNPYRLFQQGGTVAKKKNPTQGERLGIIEVSLAGMKKDIGWVKKGMMGLYAIFGSMVIALIINFMRGF